MALTLQQLVSPDLLGAANRIFAGTKEAIPVYLHESPGKVLIGGGAAGPQQIQTLAIDSIIKPWMVSTIEKIDDIIDLDFYFSPTVNASKINVYLDTLIEIGGGGTTLGLTLNNEYKRSSWWEIILNGPPLLNNDEYFQFAFVHELGHVLGLEHPFDGSDGDLGGERFGDPDASVTVMSYTKPADGWPNFYAYADIAALVSIWGLETKHQDWLIKKADGVELLLDHKSAEARIKKFFSGDELLGPAPPKPLPPKIIATNNDMKFQLMNVDEQSRWETSWDAGLNWEEGSGSNLIMIKNHKQQLNIRQKDRWGRVSDENIILIEPGNITDVTPELILPASTDRSKALRPITATVEGEQTILWSMDQSISDQIEIIKGIRAAIEEMDAAIDIDFKEIKWDESFKDKPGAIQLLFSSEIDSTISAKMAASNLINLQRKRISTQIAGIELILEDRMRIQLTNLLNEANIGYALLNGISQTFGLEPTVEPLNPSTTVMAQLRESTTIGPINQLSNLDRKALSLIYDPESNKNNNSDNLIELNGGIAVISIENPKISFREGSNMESISIIELPIQRSGNQSTRIAMGISYYDKENLIILEPWQNQSSYKIELLSGKLRNLNLEAELPIHAKLSGGALNEINIDLHKLEFGLNSAEIVDNKWQNNDFKVLGEAGNILIPWGLDERLEEKWGRVIRRIINEIDESSGIQFIEVSRVSKLLHWEFMASNNQKFNHEYIYSKEVIAEKTFNNEARWVVQLGEDPKEVFETSGIILNLEQNLLQNILLKLGLEKPEYISDGDKYIRTPVYPEDSALFNKNNGINPDQETTRASLQKLDISALEILHGKNTGKSPSKLDLPGIKLDRINAENSHWLSANGIEREIQFEITRTDNNQLESRMVISNEELSIAKEINMAPGVTSTTVSLGIPLETNTISEQFALHILSGGNNPDNSKLNYELTGSLPSPNKQIKADPITGWNLDFNGDNNFSFNLEGLMLMRFSLGTFPGSSLTAGLPQTLQNNTNQNTQLIASEYNAGEAQKWLESALRIGILDQNKNGKLDTFEDILTSKIQNIAILENINRYGLG